MNCQMFSWPLSSGARGGSGISVMLLGTLSNFGAMPAGLIEEQDRVRTGGDLGRDLIEMELHGFAVAGWQHQSGSRPKVRTDRTEQIAGLGALIVNGARA